jgi:hypothetical protein
LASSSVANFTLSKASGNVNVQYLNISKSTATGGAIWTAVNSVNGGGNIGWVFGVVSSGFFMFF